MTYFWVIFAKYRAMHDVSFVTWKKKFFCQVCWSVAFVCLSVCPSVFVCHTIFGHSFQAIVLNFFFVYVGDWLRTATQNFGEDPNPDPDLRIFPSDSSPLRHGAKIDIQYDMSKSYGWIMTKLGG